MKPDSDLLEALKQYKKAQEAWVVSDLTDEELRERRMNFVRAYEVDLYQYFHEAAKDPESWSHGLEEEELQDWVFERDGMTDLMRDYRKLLSSRRPQQKKEEPQSQPLEDSMMSVKSEDIFDHSYEENRSRSVDLDQSLSHIEDPFAEKEKQPEKAEKNYKSSLDRFAEKEKPLTAAQRGALFTFHCWLYRNCDKTGFDMLGSQGSMREFAEEFMTKSPRQQLRALWLIDHKQYKSAERGPVDDDYVPIITDIKDRMIATKAKFWKRLNGSHLYWTKLKLAMKNAEADLHAEKEKELSGEDLSEELKPGKKEKSEGSLSVKGMGEKEIDLFQDLLNPIREEEIEDGKDDLGVSRLSEDREEQLGENLQLHETGGKKEDEKEKTQGGWSKNIGAAFDDMNDLQGNRIKYTSFRDFTRMGAEKSVNLISKDYMAAKGKRNPAQLPELIASTKAGTQTLKQIGASDGLLRSTLSMTAFLGTAKKTYNDTTKIISDLHVQRKWNTLDNAGEILNDVGGLGANGASVTTAVSTAVSTFAEEAGKTAAKAAEIADSATKVGGYIGLGVSGLEILRGTVNTISGYRGQHYAKEAGEIGRTEEDQELVRKSKLMSQLNQLRKQKGGRQLLHGAIGTAASVTALTLTSVPVVGQGLAVIGGAYLLYDSMKRSTEERHERDRLVIDSELMQEGDLLRSREHDMIGRLMRRRDRFRNNETLRKKIESYLDLQEGAKENEEKQERRYESIRRREVVRLGYTCMGDASKTVLENMAVDTFRRVHYKDPELGGVDSNIFHDNQTEEEEYRNGNPSPDRPELTEAEAKKARIRVGYEQLLNSMGGKRSFMKQETTMKGREKTEKTMKDREEKARRLMGKF